jgi:menaquinone-9 beta-reductase
MTCPSGTVDNLVIGGGLAGSMAAIRLASAGCSVTLLEKERGAHHKVCGEFLSPEAVDYLRQVGIDPLELGATAIRGLRFAARGRVVESALPFTAFSLSRFALDEALLTQAERSGCVVCRGAYVERLTHGDNAWSAQLRGGQSIHAREVFLASGKHDLRGWPRGPGVQADLVAFKLHLRLAPGQTEVLRDFMELFLFVGGYGGLSLVEDDEANLCLVVRKSRLQTAGGWSGLFASILQENPLLCQRLQRADALWPRPLALSSIPYGYLASHSAGLWRIGDQAAVIPSFAGDGMAIALHSGMLAADLHLAGKSPEDFARTLHGQLRTGMSLATLIARVIVSGVGRTLSPFVLSLFPAAIQRIAAATRIPQAARIANPAQTGFWGNRAPE